MIISKSISKVVHIFHFLGLVSSFFVVAVFFLDSSFARAGVLESSLKFITSKLFFADLATSLSMSPELACKNPYQEIQQARNLGKELKWEHTEFSVKANMQQEIDLWIRNYEEISRKKETVTENERIALRETLNYITSIQRVASDQTCPIFDSAIIAKLENIKTNITKILGKPTGN